ncbi:MAG TPA: ATP-binding cassette domain-containing protein [Casimicrobiaceae bacterium]|nr:ATP-binding cassette domain-containing protein [Casimicrobiaceae bacterium]
MPLVTLVDAELAFGLHPLLDRANLVVGEGERIGLIGRNGTGKSSLLSVIAGLRDLDDGEVQRSDGARIVLVEQEPSLPIASTMRESLALRGRLENVSDERERWRIEARLVEFLHRFGLDEALAPHNASGGEQKRAALALAFALEPDLMLLDEPTNHLDIDAIRLLEEHAQKLRAAIVVTHDRAFLDAVANRIVELDRGLLRSYPGNFAAWQSRRSDELASEGVANRKFDRFWKQEEAWIRRGVEARRTRDMGRVRRLEALRVERAQRRERLGNVKLALDAGVRSGKLVVELDNVTKRFSGNAIVRDLSTRVMRGDRVGLIGPNGVGKSTLLKLMLGELQPDEGRIRRGTHLSIAYFDQLREQLDDSRTLAETISPGADWIEIGSQRRHVLSYLSDFLFPPERANAPVSTLSGGERNRLLLARLFAQPVNLVVLDEPTNDLDIESLELLEARLQSYDGTLLLVSHDRAFLDNVVTQTLVAEGEGVWREYAGGYSDWLVQRPRVVARSEVAQAAVASPPSRERAKKAGLTFKEQREIDTLPDAIEALEREQRALSARMADAGYYEQAADALKADRLRATELEHALAAQFERWAELDAKSRS